ncbi:hypothetical protein EMB92_09445 [Bifidobacterium callitrichos]|uniref:Uncharacterized protein n=1 Tax=Bifidobacterium callitrichos TaxID=762209 RepID=A0A5M9ZA56_9BIFI|nr:hypothetical protein [Bifidobacterium callitrichos]KAA8815402.1 hypothetical protein EMB92_09445 [Bifidobacterium callitrichos]
MSRKRRRTTTPRRSYVATGFPNGVRYTVNGGNLYAIVMRPSDDGVYRFERLRKGDAAHNADFHGFIRRIDLLGGPTDGEGDGEGLEWTRDEHALEVHAPAVPGDAPITFRIAIG